MTCRRRLMMMNGGESGRAAGARRPALGAEERDSGEAV